MNTILAGEETPKNIVLYLERLGPCPNDGDETIAVYSGVYADCHQCGESVLTGSLVYRLTHGKRVGLVEGRHQMPVEEYLLPEDVASQVGYDVGLYGMAARSAMKLAEELETPVVHLYLTGLTVAAIGAADGFRRVGLSVVLFSYDREIGEYIPIPTWETLEIKLATMRSSGV